MTIRSELRRLRERLDDAARAYCYRSGDPCLQWIAASADASALAESRTRWPRGFPGTVEQMVALVRAERAAPDGHPVADLQRRGEGRHGQP